MPTSDPSRYILNTDFATTQNDDKKTLSYVIPAGQVIPNGQTAVFEAVAVVGKRNAYMRPRFATSSKPGRWFLCWALVTDVSVDIAGVGTVNYPFYHSLDRISPTTVRISTSILNNSGSTMTIVAGQTITCYVNTFLSPFPS